MNATSSDSLGSESAKPVGEWWQRAVGAYLGLAVGDALGATTEFMTPAEIRHQHGVHREIIGGGWLRLRPGSVTDDTDMALALGRSILAHGDVEAHAVAQAFSDWMRSKPVDIGNTVRRGISHYRRTGEPSVQPDEHNAGNGACMRCLPVALRHFLDCDAELVSASRRQAHVTHNAAVADAGTETVLRMLALALRGSNRSSLREQAFRLVGRYPEFAFEGRNVTNPSGWIVETLRAVFQVLFAHADFEQTLVDVVNRGGDADTTGAIAGMLAGALHGVDAIPERWLARLDREVKVECRQQALELVALAVTPHEGVRLK